MQVIEAQRPWSWRLTITLHINHDRAFSAQCGSYKYLGHIRHPAVWVEIWVIWAGPQSRLPDARFR
jgi:hypothetical protein